VCDAVVVEDGFAYAATRLKQGDNTMHIVLRLIAPGAALLTCLVSIASAEERGILRAGIIGLDTSHVIAFTKILNDPKAKGPLAKVRVVAGYPGGTRDNPASWNRVDTFTQQLREQGVTIYDSIDAMLPHVDVVLLESVDGRPHLEQATKVLAAKKPLFVDKPMAASLADVLEIFRLAEEAKAPVFSSSALRFSSGYQAARDYETSKFGVVKQCTAWSPMTIEPHHPDLFWYGIHGVESLYTIMGVGCETVTRVSASQIDGAWSGDRRGTFIGKKGYGAEVVGGKDSGTAGTFEGYEPLVTEIARFFLTGKPPVAKEETIEIFAFMEAADESKRHGGVPVRVADIIERAKQQNANRTR
jgi:hypothetical protein